MTSKRRKTKVISFISGKGGVGKTALTVAVGKLLSLLEYKVLLIDSDLTTHGMTFLLGFNEKFYGVLELYNEFRNIFLKVSKKEIENLPERFICRLSSNLDYIQSTSRPALRYSEQVFSESIKINEVLKGLLDYVVRTGEYDFVIIDSQAGSVPTTFSAVSASSKVVIVMEPDPVSTYASQNVAGELGGHLPRDSFFVINKLSVQEASGYVAIEKFLRILRHLSPIPFDFEVRRCFMIRQIPIDKNKPSAFMFGIMRMVKDLLPETDEKLSKLEEEIRKIALAPTERRLNELEMKIQNFAELKASLSDELHLLRSKRERYLSIKNISQMMFLLASLILIVMSFYGELFSIMFTPALVVVAVTLCYVGVLWLYSERKRTPIEEESREIQKRIAVTEEKIDSLRRESDANRNLLVARSMELMLEKRNNKYANH